jgi:hypothetical protein
VGNSFESLFSAFNSSSNFTFFKYSMIWRFLAPLANATLKRYPVPRLTEEAHDGFHQGRAVGRRVERTHRP